nr:reverse transcriptase domain-containing protein [Tanacetum cinerariifolium]
MKKTYAAVIAGFQVKLWMFCFFEEANQASKFVQRSSIVPIRLAASRNLFACPKSKKQVTPNLPEGGSKATSEGDWIKVQKKGKGKDVLDNRVSDLPDPVSHAPLAFNSHGEHSEGKPALAFFTPTRISLGGSSEPLTLSLDHKPLGGMPPKRTSTSEAPALTQAAIRKLVVDSVATALKTQASTMANVDDANKNPEPREAPVARKCSYKEFMSFQAFNFKGSEGAIALIH